MRRKTSREKIILKDLGDGLVLRRSTPEDAKALAAFHAEVQRSPGARAPDEGIAAWTMDLMNGRHPTFNADDFTIVEDVGTGAIVSSMNLISQTWSYEGIELAVGRPEIVSTLPGYRRRGLVRAQFDVIHEWSSQRGEMMTAITGIPYFYRQFGYEMAVSHGGGRTGDATQVPALGKAEKEPFRLRPAREKDLPFIARMYEEGEKRYLLSCVRDRALWRYELEGRCRMSVNRRELCIIESAKRRPAGFLAHPGRLHADTMAITRCELRPGVSWPAAVPSVMRQLKALGEKCAARQKRELRKLAFMLGVEHPICELYADRLPAVHKSYAWYVRVPDLPRLLRHISPVIEQRLAGSALAGHTGEIRLSFYRGGLRMAFRKGRLRKVEAWTPSHEDRGNAAFPDLTFLQVLFGYRSVDELSYAFPDCRVGAEVHRLLLNTLFPKQPSAVWPMS